MHQKVVLTSQGASTGRRNRLSGTSWSLARESIKSCFWGGKTPGTRTCQKLSDSQASLKRRIRGPGGQQLWQEPAMSPLVKKANSALGCIRKSDSALVRHTWTDGSWIWPPLEGFSHLSLSAGLGRLFLSCRITTLIFKVPFQHKPFYNSTPVEQDGVGMGQWVPGTACCRNPPEWILCGSFLQWTDRVRCVRMDLQDLECQDQSYQR